MCLALSNTSTFLPGVQHPGGTKPSRQGPATNFPSQPFLWWWQCPRLPSAALQGNQGPGEAAWKDDLLGRAGFFTDLYHLW